MRLALRLPTLVSFRNLMVRDPVDIQAHPAGPSRAEEGDRLPVIPLSEPPDPPPIGVVRDELHRAGIVTSSTPIRAIPLPGNPRRHDCLTRRRFRILAADRVVCLLTLGHNLASLAKRVEAFAQACPEIACRLFFYRRVEGWDYLGVEFFDGDDLETLTGARRLSPATTREHVAAVISALERTWRPSSAEAAAHELDVLFSRLCALPIFAGFDQSFLRHVVFPFVRAGALTGPHRTRWTNGDLIPRNVLVDRLGNVRLIDCEFASRTHFYGEDAWRWRTLSSLPSPAHELPGWDQAEAQGPWLEALFLLKQVTLAHEINGAHLAVGDSRAFLDRLLTLTTQAHGGFKGSAFLHRLGTLQTLESDLARTEEALRVRDAKIERMHRSFSWRATSWLRALRRYLLDPGAVRRVFRPAREAETRPRAELGAHSMQEKT
ncbi:MAG TPA: hypothetical protein VGD81_12605 [Opitutaceae bacterium]